MVALVLEALVILALWGTGAISGLIRNRGVMALPLLVPARGPGVGGAAGERTPRHCRHQQGR